MSSKIENRRMTSVITGLTFFLVAITGLLLFFHIKSRAIIDLHEWAGIGFLVAATFHLVLNWKAFVSYLKHRAFWVGFVGLLIACALIISLQGEDRRPRGYRHSQTTSTTSLPG